MNKDKTFELVNRLNEIRVEQQKLELEYNRIIKELWDIIPNLKNDPNIQLQEKIKVKKVEE